MAQDNMFLCLVLRPLLAQDVSKRAGRYGNSAVEALLQTSFWQLSGPHSQATSLAPDNREHREGGRVDANEVKIPHSAACALRGARARRMSAPRCSKSSGILLRASTNACVFAYLRTDRSLAHRPRR